MEKSQVGSWERSADKTLERPIKKKIERRHEQTKLKMNKRDKDTDATAIKRIIREYHDRFFVNIFENLNAMD